MNRQLKQGGETGSNINIITLWPIYTQIIIEMNAYIQHSYNLREVTLITKTYIHIFRFVFEC